MTPDTSTACVEEEYLILSIADELYGLDLLRVVEIRCWEGVTRLPNQADYVIGVVNLRGVIIPVIDLRERLQMVRCDYTKETIVIVLRVSDGMGVRKIGLVVDAVSDVVEESDAEVRGDVPEYGDDIDIDLIEGLTAVGERVIRLLNVDKLLPDRLSADNV